MAGGHRYGCFGSQRPHCQLASGPGQRAYRAQHKIVIIDQCRREWPVDRQAQRFSGGQMQRVAEVDDRF